MRNPIKDIIKFNKDANLLGKGYSDALESSFQIEEALEGFDGLDKICEQLMGPDHPTEKMPKEISRYLMKNVEFTGSDVDRLDKACDAIVFAVGSMAKLGLNYQQIVRALNAVMKSNQAKLAMPKDEYGKLMKPDDFVGPEPELQKILDERD